MALRPVFAVFLLAFALSGIELSTCEIVKGKVSCLDCSSSHYDFSGIKVVVKCDKVKKVATTLTETEGSFDVELPSDRSNTPSPLNCLAKLLGGPTQLYASRQNVASKIVKADHDSTSYTISSPLAFSTTCPSVLGGKSACGLPNDFGSSKTVDLPLPREWGLAPSSYYVPFVPIIGIP